jgi:hypothetical protein
MAAPFDLTGASGSEGASDLVRGENGGVKAGYIGEWALKKEKWRENYILVEGKLYFGWGEMDFWWKNWRE